MVSPIISMLMTLNYSSLSPHLSLMLVHLKLNLDKTELVFLLEKDCLLPDLSLTFDNSTVSQSQSAKAVAKPYIIT